MPRRMRRSAKKTITLPDLSKIEGRSLVPEGEYLFEVKGVDEGEGDAGPYLKWSFIVADGKYKNTTINPYVTSFSENSLWNLRSLLEALNFPIPDEPQEIDPDELVGLQMKGTIEHDTYQGRKQSKLVDFQAVEQEAEEEEEKPVKKKRAVKEEEEEPEEEAPRKGKKSKKAEVKITEEEINEMTEDELEELVDEAGLEVDLKSYKTISKMRAGIIDACEEAGIIEAAEEEAEEEEPEQPTKKSSRSRR